MWCSLQKLSCKLTINTYSDAKDIANTVMNNDLDYSADFDYSGDWTDKDDLDNILDGNIQENFNNETKQLLEQFWWTTTTPFLKS